MSSRRILKAIVVLFFTVVILTPLFYWDRSVFPYTIPKTALFQALVEVIVALWAALAISDRRYRLRMTPLVWAILAYLGVLTLTAFAGIDPLRSFFSTEQRAFGVVTFYHLGALALVAMAVYRELPWKKLWYASFGASLATVGIAVLQLYIPNLLLDENIAGRPGATFGNPSFFAGYLIVSIFLAGYYLFVFRKQVAFLSAVIAVDALGIFLTKTRGDLVGLFFGMLVFVALLAIRPPETEVRILASRRFYAGVIMLLIVLGGLTWATRASPLWEHVPGVNRLRSISLDASGGDLLPRIIAYRAAWRGFLERPFLGWGFENFNVIFSKYYDPRALEFGYAETDFDKPHNVPLEELTAGGIPLFLAYVAVFGALLWEAKKKKDTLLFQTMVALVAAYAVRSLFIFDTIGPALLLYLAMGFVGGARASASNGEGGKNAPQSIRGGSFVAALVLAAIVIYVLNITSISAAHSEFLGYKRLGDHPERGLAEFRRASERWSPYQWEFIRDNANTVAQAYFYNHAVIAKDEVVRLIDAMKGVAEDHPMDAYNHYLLASVYNLASDIDPEHYLAEAERRAQIALELSPNRQEILFYLAKTKSLKGDNAAALEIAKRALDLDPKVADSHFYYGMLAFALGRNEEGYNEVNTAIKMGRPWHSFYEPRVAADYFADAGHLPEAIDLYRAALVIQPGDLEAEIKLGAAYFINGRSDLARPLLADAASRFDFTKSPQYGAYKPILDALGIALPPPAARP